MNINANRRPRGGGGRGGTPSSRHQRPFGVELGQSGIQSSLTILFSSPNWNCSGSAKIRLHAYRSFGGDGHKCTCGYFRFSFSESCRVVAGAMEKASTMFRLFFSRDCRQSPTQTQECACVQVFSAVSHGFLSRRVRNTRCTFWLSCRSRC